MGKVPGVLDRLENTPRMPDTLYADGGYPSVPSIPKVLDKGVEFFALVNRGPLGDQVMGRDRFEFAADGGGGSAHGALLALKYFLYARVWRILAGANRNWSKIAFRLLFPQPTPLIGHLISSKRLKKQIRLGSLIELEIGDMDFRQLSPSCRTLTFRLNLVLSPQNNGIESTSLKGNTIKFYLNKKCTGNRGLEYNGLKKET